MLQSTLSMQSWLDKLTLLYPVSGMLHVGAGSVEAVRCCQRWRAPAAIFIEPQKGRLASIFKAIRGMDGWVASDVVVAQESAKSIFHEASNPAESGLVQPELLSVFWRNLKTLNSRECRTTTIDDLLEAQSGTVFNWVHVDCFPALSILQGAQESIRDWDVVVARAILKECPVPQAGKEDLDVFMSRMGFVCMAVEPERHPAIGQVLYVRDWKKVMQNELKNQKSAHTARIHVLEQEISQAQQERDEQGALAARRAEETAALGRELKSLRATLEDLRGQHAKLEKERDEQGALAARRAEEAAALGRELKSLRATVEDLRGQHAKLEKERDEQGALAARRAEEAAALGRELKSLRATVEDLRRQHAKLEKEQDEHNHKNKTQKEAFEKQIRELKEELACAKRLSEIAEKKERIRLRDLNHLREKYKELTLAHEALTEMHEKLRLGLEAAAARPGAPEMEKPQTRKKKPTLDKEGKA